MIISGHHLKVIYFSCHNKSDASVLHWCTNISTLIFLSLPFLGYRLRSNFYYLARWFWSFKRLYYIKKSEDSKMKLYSPLYFDQDDVSKAAVSYVSLLNISRLTLNVISTFMQRHVYVMDVR